MSLRVGVDASSLANPRGYGRFTRELLSALFAQPQHAARRDADRHDAERRDAERRDAQWLLFTDARAHTQADALATQARAAGTRVEVIEVAQGVSPTVAAAADGNRSPVDMLRFTRAVSKANVDVFFSPTVYTYFPLPPGVRLLACFHDTIAEDYPALTLPSARARLFWRAKTKLALAQAKLVLTVSDFSARRLQAVYRIAPERLRVAVEAPSKEYYPAAHEAARIVETASRYGIPLGMPWLIYVGGFNPHKHVDVLAGAHARVVQETGSAVQLVLVGPVDDVFHGSLPAIRARIAQERTTELVTFAGFVPDEALRYLLAGAVALALPSECEGFGLPAVEAAACGTPVVATQNSPLPELLAGGGHFVAPRDEVALAAAMRRLLEDAPHRAACAAGALAAAQRLDWSVTADITWKAIRDTAA